MTTFTLSSHLTLSQACCAIFQQTGLPMRPKSANGCWQYSIVERNAVPKEGILTPVLKDEEIIALMSICQYRHASPHFFSELHFAISEFSNQERFAPSYLQPLVLATCFMHWTFAHVGRN